MKKFSPIEMAGNDAVFDLSIKGRLFVRGESRYHEPGAVVNLIPTSLNVLITQIEEILKMTQAENGFPFNLHTIPIDFRIARNI